VLVYERSVEEEGDYGNAEVLGQSRRVQGGEVHESRRFLRRYSICCREVMVRAGFMEIVESPAGGKTRDPAE
jgi:hypothetical protein